MPEPNPRSTKWRVASQATLGLPGLISAATWHDVRLRPGSKASPSWQRVVDPRIDGSAFQAPRLDGIISLDAVEVECSLNAEEFIYFAGWASNKSTNVNTVGSIYTETCVIDSGTTTWSDYLMMQIDRNDGFPMLFYDGRVRTITVTADENNVISVTVGLAFGGYHQWADGTVVLNATNSMQILGLPDSAMLGQATAAEQRIYVKLTDVTAWAAGAGTVTAVVKVGAAASYGAQSFTIAGDTWTQAVDSNVAISDLLANRVGDPGQQIMLYLPSTATPTLNDELYFALAQPSWTPSYSSAPSISSVHAELTYGGVDEKLTGFTWTWNVPNVVRHGPGQKFPVDNLRQGVHAGEVTIPRVYRNYNLAEQRRAGDLIKFQADMRTKSAAGSGWPWIVRLVSPNVDFTGEDPDTADDTFAEELTGTCHEDTGEPTFTAPMNVEIVSTLATPAA